MEVTKKVDALEQTLSRIQSNVLEGGTLAPLLPLIFRLRGKAYSLDWSHFMFEPIFKVNGMSRRMMLLCGRQVSKCCRIGGHGHVYLSDGRRVAGTQLVPGDEVLAFDDNDLKVTKARVVRTYDSGVKPCLRVTTRLGTVVDIAETHPVRTPLGYTVASSLKKGQRVGSLKVGAEFPVSPLPIEHERICLTALMIGDGCCGLSNNFSYVSNSPESQQLFLDMIGPGVRIATKAGTSAKQYSISRNHPLREWLIEDGLWGRYAYEKYLPNWVFCLNRQQAARFVECLWTTDGLAKPRNNGGATIAYYTTSNQLAYDLRALLLKFGILSSVKRRNTSHRDAFVVRVEGREAQQRFVAEFDVPDKPSNDIWFPSVERNNRDTLPLEFNQIIWNLCDQAVYLRDGSSLRSAGLRRKPKYALSRDKARRYMDWFKQQGIDATELARLTDSDLIWDTVKSVERIEAAPCWDIEVETHHNYVLDGLVVHNSTSMAASQIIRAAIQPNYNIVTVMPLYEQVRKFSQNYVRPFITTSGIKHRIISELGTNSVLQRQVGPLEHNSSLFYSYSSGDPNRVRGIPADEADLDEIQDLDHEDIPIIEACMGASPYKVVRITGTPKTFDNTAHLLWEDTSQAHWHIPCICGKLCRAAVEGDLIAMIGDNSERPDGSNRTLVCPGCGRNLDSRQGFYVHDYPDRRATFPGYHAPQPILPMHYESPPDWEVILETMRDKPTYIFYNEVLGESYDAGAKILTYEEIQNACKAVACQPKDIQPSQFIASATGIDWGGRGKEKTSDTDDFISNTAFAVACMRSNGIIEIPWLHKVPYAVDMSHEAKMAVNIAAQSRSNFIALDYGGQGNVQEQQVRAWGWPRERVVPFTYSVMAPTKPIVFYNPPQHRGVRSSYTLDKPRSILLLAELIKRKLVLLPDDDKYLKDHLRDFLNIYEESLDNPSGSPRRLVKRMSRRTDDIVHAINFAVMALYNYTEAWPKLSSIFVEQDIMLQREKGK